MTRPRVLASGAILFLVMAAARSLSACSEEIPGPLWSFTRHPDFPLQPFAAGRLGILQRTYARSYLTVAYLYLSGRSYTPQEQEALLDLWERRLGPEAARGQGPEPYRRDDSIDL